MPAPHELLRLVEQFERNQDAYRSGAYNETQLRREFLDPFFETLGWDVDNRQGYAERYKDVIHEDAIRVGGATRAPDYCFRVGGQRKFFVEAKKPSVNVHDDISPAFQLRRYAWSAKLPLSILTDFEELAVYDCRRRPDKADRASTGRLLYFTYTDYPQRWDEITGLFSREAVLKGAFDKYAEAREGKRGTAEVDNAFLAEIEGWREALARNLALRNPSLSQRALNFAVQVTIDRMIFLRICEDRAIEPYGQLQALQNGSRVYPRLLDLFHRADDRYNSGLFHFQSEPGRPDPDDVTPGLTLDDKPLKEILRTLYYPDSPYEFSVLPADILGQVYERFLGKVIRLTAGHQAKVEEKPEVRKAGGVYYTPTYIVEYIVRNTVGKLLEGKRPEEVAGPEPDAPGRRRRRSLASAGPAAPPLRVLDPACGSGSFLIGAYQFLLDWYRDRYVDDDPAKWAGGANPRLYQAGGGEWCLTTSERKRILLAHIYGVDIDTQAVEVTKLSLLLKVLEGESDESLNSQMRLFQERALPDLSANVKCGNSLIGPDFYDGQQLLLLDDEERHRINVFDWQGEFPQVFSGDNPGFDAVIGNPPYILLQHTFRDDMQSLYYRAHFSAASFKVDTYHLFIAKGIALTRTGGRCSMITPANFLTNNHLAGLRRLMLDESQIETIVVLDAGVFRGVDVDNAVFVVTRGGNTSGVFTVAHALPDPSGLCEGSSSVVSAKHARDDPYVLFTGTEGGTISGLWERVRGDTHTLGSLADVNFGKQLRDRRKFLGDVVVVDSLSAVVAPYKPCYTGKDIVRYHVAWGRIACLDSPCAKCGGCWDPSKQDAKNKLLTRQVGEYPVFALDPYGYQCLNTVFMVNLLPGSPLGATYVLGILNSKLTRALWLDRFYDKRRTFPKVKGTYLKELPIRPIDFGSPADRERHDRMVALVERMLELHRGLRGAGTAHEKTLLQREIDATDRQIDRLVYDLYDLTEEEIRIVEAATAR